MMRNQILLHVVTTLKDFATFISMNFYQKLSLFFKQTIEDQRIPRRDLKTLCILFVLIISPLDFIPDWISFYGVIDDVIMLALICDYLFNILDQEILLSHYPWGMKSFANIRKIANIFSSFSPSFISDYLWKFKKSPF